jgi:hypothetical protein
MRHRILVAMALAWLGVTLLASPASARSKPMTATYIIRTVSAAYGDRTPHVVGVQKTRTETSGALMYVIRLSGTFHRGRHRARYLTFSALAARWYVWGVQGYDRRHHLVWIDPTLPRP